MSNFKDYVTSTAFNLSLSKSMIDALSMLDQYGNTWCNLMTFRALENRGLVERDLTANADLPNDLRREISPVVQLTEAGRAVVPLLKLSGLYVQYAQREEGAFISPPHVTLKKEFQKDIGDD